MYFLIKQFIVSDVHDVRQISFDQPHAGSSLTDPHSFKMAFTENGHGKPRRKRSLHNNNNNNEYTMEILVAVDRKMQEYHGEETRNYVLTLMSIVSNRKDSLRTFVYCLNSFSTQLLTGVQYLCRCQYWKLNQYCCSPYYVFKG